MGGLSGRQAFLVFPAASSLHRRGALRAVPLALGRRRYVDARVVEPFVGTLKHKLGTVNLYYW